MQIWNDICRKVDEYKKQRITENVIQELWMTIFMELGWSKLKNEIIPQAEIPIGSNGKLKPDILLNIENRNVLVIELKRPNHDFYNEQNNQLISYMLQLKLKFGVLIGSTIQLYYDDLMDSKKPVIVSTIDFTPDNEEGIEFFSMLSRQTFTESSFLEYCNKLVKKQLDKDQSDKIIKELIANNEEIISIIEKYFSDKYSKNVSKHVIESLDLVIRKKAQKSFLPIDNTINDKKKISAIILETDNEQKIGITAKKLFSHFLVSGQFSDDEIANLCDENYSKRIFNTSFSILREVIHDDLDEVRSDHNGYFRYWKEVYSVNGKRYVLSSQWYRKQYPALNAYFKRLFNYSNNQIEIDEFILNGNRYKIILSPDNLSQYPHLIDPKTGYIVKNQKGVCREFLKPYGFNVPFDADTFLTHDSIRLVYKVLNNLNLTDKEVLIKE